MKTSNCHLFAFYLLHDASKIPETAVNVSAVNLSGQGRLPFRPANRALASPGDLFLLKKAVSWYSTCLITGISGDNLETIEGNTNDDGSNNGNGVYKCVRNFKTPPIDIFSMPPPISS